MTRSSLTEETPATPGWVDGRVAEVLGRYGIGATPARDAYTECLGGARGAVDVDASHDRCRRALLDAVSNDVTDREELARELMALEAEISADT